MIGKRILSPCFSPNLGGWRCSRSREKMRGFTLVEIIIVIVITGILGGIVAIFIKAPIQQYFDVSRRSDMTDIADTALRRIGRDLRLALPNSVRISGSVSGNNSGSCTGSEICYLEFLPTSVGGRYRVAGGGTNCPGSPSGEALDFTVADGCFGVLGGMPTGFTTFAPGDTDKVAIYNLGINGANAYAGDNTAAVKTSTSNANIINLTAGKLFPFESPSARFDIINQPVSYVCNPTLGTLTRVSGYSITPTQPTTTFPAGNQQNLLAKNLTNCSFTYDASVVAQRSGLVTMSLSITEANPSSSSEKVTLYNSVHVSNLP